MQRSGVYEVKCFMTIKIKAWPTLKVEDASWKEEIVWCLSSECVEWQHIPFERCRKFIQFLIRVVNSPTHTHSHTNTLTIRATFDATNTNTQTIDIFVGLSFWTTKTFTADNKVPTRAWPYVIFDRKSSVDRPDEVTCLAHRRWWQNANVHELPVKPKWRLSITTSELLFSSRSSAIFHLLSRFAHQFTLLPMLFLWIRLAFLFKEDIQNQH